jgi:hypothetical protein
MNKIGLLRRAVELWQKDEESKRFHAFRQAIGFPPYDKMTREQISELERRYENHCINTFCGNGHKW